MTNAEKYLKDGVSVEEVANEFECFCLALKENYNVMTYKQEMEQFLNCEIKSTLSEDERVILRNIAYDSEYKYIYRSLGMLYLSENEKLTCVDRLPGMHHLFQFIKERRRIFNTRIVRR